ncbi:MAG: Sec-independent protein translocase protein TatB [Gammaproteobacteria bacterium]
MFDVGFWELVMVGVVGLVVIGPERLPGFARVTGLWLGKARRTIAMVKQEIQDELYAEDLRRSLRENSPAEEIRSLIDETSKDFDKTVNPDALQGSRLTAKPELTHQASKPD